MPNRILKESICSSDTIDLLTAEEERLFCRLIVKCDDYGRFDGRPSMVRSACFPLKTDSISLDAVAAWLRSLEAVGLIRIYTVDGRPYLELVTWCKHQQRRATKSKYPDPPAIDSNCYQSPAHVPVNVNDKRESINDIRETGIEIVSFPVDSPTEEPSAGTKTPRMTPRDPVVQEIFAYYKARIQPSARICPVDKIKARLKAFTAEELKRGIDQFAADRWWMEKNGNRGAPWFFHSDARSEQFLNLTRKEQPDGPHQHGATKPRNGSTPCRAEAGRPSPFAKYR